MEDDPAGDAVAVHVVASTRAGRSGPRSGRSADGRPSTRPRTPASRRTRCTSHPTRRRTRRTPRGTARGSTDAGAAGAGRRGCRPRTRGSGRGRDLRRSTRGPLLLDFAPIATTSSLTRSSISWRRDAPSAGFANPHRSPRWSSSVASTEEGPVISSIGSRPARRPPRAASGRDRGNGWRSHPGSCARRSPAPPRTGPEVVHRVRPRTFGARVVAPEADRVDPDLVAHLDFGLVHERQSGHAVRRPVLARDVVWPEARCGVPRRPCRGGGGSRESKSPRTSVIMTLRPGWRSNTPPSISCHRARSGTAGRRRSPR